MGGGMHRECAWGSHKPFMMMRRTAERIQKNMQQHLDTFFAHLSADGATPASTLKAYRTDLTQCMSFLAEHGIVDIQALHPNHLQAFCAWLEQHGYATATIARRIAALRAFGAFLLAAGLLTWDPCLDLHP